VGEHFADGQPKILRYSGKSPMLPELVTDIPGPRSRALAEELRHYESRNITYVSPGFPVFWERAAGTNVWDADGNRFLDLTAAFAVTALGHGPDAVRAAAHEQIDTLYHAMGDVHPSPLKVELCRELSRLTFETWTHGAQSGKTILTNSGSEAVEAALKTALMATGKPGVLAFEGGYHGLGLGALAAGGIDYFKTPFLRQVPPIGTLLPFPDEGEPWKYDYKEYAQALDERLTQGAKGPNGERVPIGAIMVEPIQGRGGEIVPDVWFHPLLHEAADHHGALLIHDEIYTGFFRTGECFAGDRWEAMPDIICLGKALTGGFPLAAAVGRAAVMDAWPESNGEALHTSTFLGNPLGCRMALANLQAIWETDWKATVDRASATLHAELHRLQDASPRWGGLRGRGLMLGLEVVDPEDPRIPDPARAGRMVEALLARGLILLAGSPTGHVLSFCPPLIISDEEIRFAVETIGEVNLRLSTS